MRVPILAALALLAVPAVLAAVRLARVRRDLAAREANCQNAMAQIGVQLSSLFNALLDLAEAAQDRAGQEARDLAEDIRARRSPITASSTPEEAAELGAVLSHALARVSAMAERYPELAADERFLQYRAAVDSRARMLRTSRLIYNDSAASLDRSLRAFPASLAAPLLGFRRREPLEYRERK